MQFLRETEKLTKLKKIVAAGTCKEYGATQGACTEGMRISPDGYFSWAKQTLADYFGLSCRHRQIGLVWFRIFYVYGPRQRPGSLIPTLIKAFSSNTVPNIQNPLAANDYIFIDDVAEAFTKAIEDEDCRGTFNLGSGTLTSVASISRMLERTLCGRDEFSTRLMGKSTIAQPQLSGMWADTTLSRNALDWTLRITLAEGIERTCKDHSK